MPVLADDIIFSGRTIAPAACGLKEAGFVSVCAVGVHGIFAGAAHEEIPSSGVTYLVTTNTIPHAPNLIDVSEAVARAAADLCGRK